MTKKAMLESQSNVHRVPPRPAYTFVTSFLIPAKQGAAALFDKDPLHGRTFAGGLLRISIHIIIFFDSLIKLQTIHDDFVVFSHFLPKQIVKNQYFTVFIFYY